VGGLRVAPLRGQTQRHGGGRSHRCFAPYSSRRLGICLQSRHRSHGGWHRFGGVRHGQIRLSHWYGHRPRQARRCARIYRFFGGRCLHYRSCRGSLSNHRSHLFVRHGYPRFLAAGACRLPRARPALYGRAGLFPACHFGHAHDDGSYRAESHGFHLRCFPPTQYQIPTTGS